MQTAYDWIAVAMFAGIAVLFLQRSVGPALAGDRSINYLPPVIGCVAGNYCGNHATPIGAMLLFAVTLAYIAIVLRPFGFTR